MNIAFIHPSWPGDEGTGATHSATQVVRGLAERGHDVTVYCTSAPPSDADIHPDLALEHLDLSGPPYHTNTQLNRALKSRSAEFDQYDVTNCYLPSGLAAMEYIGNNTSTATGVTLNAYGGICPKNDLMYLDREQCTHRSLARCARCIVQTSSGHDEYSAPYRTASRFGNLRLIRQAADDVDAIDFFRAPSGHVKDHYVEFGFPDDAIHVIPHPLDDQFDVEHESDFSEPYRLLYVGYLETQKGVDKLIPILEGVRERLGVEATLTVVGDGGQRSAMERQAAERGLEDAVSFEGFVENHRLPDVYASHDVFLHPGIWEEPLARVYIEALATGTPIVTRDYGSIEEIIGGGGVTTDGSVEGFVDALAALLSEDRLSDTSEQAKQKMQSYRSDAVVGELETVYRSVAEQ